MLAWTEANICSDFIRLNRSIARSRRRNDRWLFSSLQDLTLLIYGSPEVEHLPIDPHIHLVQMPPPMPETPHVAHSLAPDIGRGHATEAVPPQPDRFMADIDPTFEEQISTFRNDSGKRTWSITTRRMMSGEEWKYRNGSAGLRGLGMTDPTRHFTFSKTVHSF